MALHRLTDITLGVPNVQDAVEYYTQFGLLPAESNHPGERWFGTTGGGSHQLRLVHSEQKKLLAVGIGADDPDDLDRIASSLEGFGAVTEVTADGVRTIEPATGLGVTVSIAPKVPPRPEPEPHRPNIRADALRRTAPARPRKLGHVMIMSADAPTTRRFFGEGLGFKVSDEVRDIATFMRCSTDHHNVVVATSPVNYMHHSSWELFDVDEIGRAVQTALEDHPERHTWGLGRHWVGANYFYYLRDPAGNLTEYYAGMDEITDDQLWQPGVFEGDNLWGPPPPASMIDPQELADLMAGSH